MIIVKRKIEGPAGASKGPDCPRGSKLLKEAIIKRHAVQDAVDNNPFMIQSAQLAHEKAFDEWRSHKVGCVKCSLVDDKDAK